MAGTAQRKDRQTTFVAVTTMEELPLLSESERGAMIASLEAAAARIDKGEYVTHVGETFVGDMMAIRAAALSTKKV